MNQQPTPREIGYYASLASVGMEMALPAAVGAYLDQWLDTRPWLTAVLTFLGFAAGLSHLVLILNKKEKEESSDKKPPP